MLFGILLTIQTIVCLALGGLVLIQRSEGGALGVGGGPSGFMSARGAGNLLTRATSILGFLFFAGAIAMTIVGNLDAQRQRASALENIDLSKMTAPATQQPQPAPPPAAAPASSAPSLADLPLGTTAPAPASSSSAAATSSSRTPAPRPAASASSSSNRPVASSATPSASAPATSSATSPAQ